MLVHGIPEFRLNRSVIDKEIDLVVDMGVELKLNAPLRLGFGIQQLHDMGFQAIFLSIGAQRGAGPSVVLELGRGACHRNWVWRAPPQWKAPTHFCGDSTSASSTLSSECHLKKRGQLSGAPAGRI